MIQLPLTSTLGKYVQAAAIQAFLQCEQHVSLRDEHLVEPQVGKALYIFPGQNTAQTTASQALSQASSLQVLAGEGVACDQQGAFSQHTRPS